MRRCMGSSSYFDSLRPATDTQNKSLDSARDLARKFADTQMLMARQLANPFPPYVLIVVVCWASALFLGNGLVATPNAVSVGAHLLGAIAIGSAIFLMLELSQPYTGVIRLSSAGVDRLLQVLGEARREGGDLSASDATRNCLGGADVKSSAFFAKSGAVAGGGGESRGARQPASAGPAVGDREGLIRRLRLPFPVGRGRGGRR